MRAVIASAVSAISFIHAALLAIPAILLVRLWGDAGIGPPMAERIVIIQSTVLLVVADIVLGAVSFKAAFYKIRASVSALGLPCCMYVVLPIVLFLFSDQNFESDVLGHWIESVWKFLGSGLVLCALSAVVLLTRPANRGSTAP